MTHSRFAALTLAALTTACGANGGSGPGPDGGGNNRTGFAGDWVARPYRWNVKCSNSDGSRQGGSTAETGNISSYRLEVDGSNLRMYVTDQAVGCVQRFTINGNRATHTGDDGDCMFTVDGVDEPGLRTTQSDVLVLSADGASFDETAKYKVVYAGDYVCTGNDGGTFFRK